MKNILVEMMSNFMELNEEQKQAIKDAFPVRTFLKDTELLKEGQIAKDAYAVIKGCIREYYIHDGEEITTEFYTETQSAVNFDSMSNGKPSKYYFKCAEETIVAILNPEKENALYEKFPHFGAVCRVEMEKMLGASQGNFLAFKNATPTERYLNLSKNRPDLLQRVPQYQLASYLGIKAETLSRIRKKVYKMD